MYSVLLSDANIAFTADAGLRTVACPLSPKYIYIELSITRASQLGHRRDLRADSTRDPLLINKASCNAYRNA